MREITSNERITSIPLPPPQTLPILVDRHIKFHDAFIVTADSVKTLHNLVF